jgi:hypothetical protein
MKKSLTKVPTAGSNMMRARASYTKASTKQSNKASQRGSGHGPNGMQSFTL